MPVLGVWDPHDHHVLPTRTFPLLGVSTMSIILMPVIVGVSFHNI